MVGWYQISARSPNHVGLKSSPAPLSLFGVSFSTFGVSFSPSWARAGRAARSEARTARPATVRAMRMDPSRRGRILARRVDAAPTAERERSRSVANRRRRGLRESDLVATRRVSLADDRRRAADRLEPERPLAARAPGTFRRTLSRLVERRLRAELVHGVHEPFDGLLDLDEARPSPERDPERRACTLGPEPHGLERGRGRRLPVVAGGARRDDDPLELRGQIGSRDSEEGEVERVRQPIERIAVQDDAHEGIREPEVEEVAQRDHALARLDHVLLRELERRREADDPRRVLRARAPALLVAGSVEQRLELDAASDDQAAHSLGTVKLVGRDREEVD